MNLYEIDEGLRRAIELMLEAVDPETGEIAEGVAEDVEAFSELRDQKLEAYAVVVKELEAEADALKAELVNLSRREKAIRNRIEFLKWRLKDVLRGEKFTSAKAEISFRKSQAVDVLDDTEIPEAFWVKQDPKLDRAGIRKALKAGEDVPGAVLVENLNIQIK